MKPKFIESSLTAITASAALFFANFHALAADLAVSVQGAGQTIAESTVTIYAAGTGAPMQLAQGNADDNGALKLTYGNAPADSVLYVIARGGTPKAATAKGPNDAIALLAVLGGVPSENVVVNEFSTVASAWTSAQLLKGRRWHCGGYPWRLGNRSGDYRHDKRGIA